MKKSILAVVIVLLIIASLPTIGNTFIKNTIDERLIELKSFGLQTSKDETYATYLNTSRHLEFLLQDSKSFLNHLKHYSDKQIPPYVNAMLEGTLIGADIKYSNLPFAKAFEIEIYPMKLSTKMSKELKKEDLNLYKYTEKFLLQKGMLYHIEYNLLNDDFKGYIKDINEKHILENGMELILSLEKANFKGNGELLAPKELSSKVKEFHFNMLENQKSLNLLMSDFKSSSNFDSHNTYLTSVEIQSVLISSKGTADDVNITMKQFRANTSSNDQGTQTQLNAKTSIKSLELSSNLQNLSIKKFNFDLALSGLDKKEYLNLTQTQDYNAAFDISIRKLLSNGLVLEIADFSVKEFSKDSDKNIKGFAVKSKFTLKENRGLVRQNSLSPFALIPYISLESELRISKEMYTKLKNNNLILGQFNGYEKEDGDDYIFVLKFIDTKASVNGRSLN